MNEINEIENSSTDLLQAMRKGAPWLLLLPLLFWGLFVRQQLEPPPQPPAQPASLAPVTAVGEKPATTQEPQTSLRTIPASTALPAETRVHTSLPLELAAMSGTKRKETFLRLLYPVVIKALQEVAAERQRLVDITARMGLSPTDAIPEPMQLLARGATVEEAEFLGHLTRKYRARTVDELLRRVNLLPPSLILAQGAIESSWGTSRFAREGNNIFGIWTWAADGIVPIRRDPGKNHKVARYPSILDSVRSYLLNINRHPAYATLRALRQESMDPLVLADGLEPYSARGAAYIEEVKAIIAANRLVAYDHQLSTIIAAPADSAADNDLTAL